MKKIKFLLTGVLCAALALPSVNAGAIVINRHSAETSEEDSGKSEEETINIDTTINDYEYTIDIPTSEIKEFTVKEPADIVFVIDSTGSMASYIQNVADNIKAFSKFLEDNKVDARMAVIEYRDITCDGNDSTIVHQVDGSVWHKSTAELVKTLDIIKSGVDGGGDLPETLIDALGYLVDGKTFDFGRKDSELETHKFAIVLSDANFKENNNFGYTEKNIIDKLKEQNINTSVITSEWAHDYYLNIAEKDNEENPYIFDINAENFSEQLNKLANGIFKTIREEIKDVKYETVKGIEVTCTGKGTIKVGNYTKLNAVILPETAENKTVKWSVRDKSIAKIEVSDNTLECTVTGLSEGTTRVTAETEDGGFKGSYEITVARKPSGEVTIAIEVSKRDIKVTPSKKTISKKKNFNINVVLTKDFTKDKEQEEIDDIWENDIDSIEYRSSKSSVAYVDSKGKVTAKKKGKAFIKTIITLADGNEYIYKTTVYVK